MPSAQKHLTICKLLMQKLRDKIRKLVKTTCRRADQESQRKKTTKPKKEGQCLQMEVLLSGYFFRKISQHFNPKNEFLFQRQKKNVSDYDDVWYRRRHCLSANVSISPFSTRRLFSREATSSFVGIAFADVISDADKGKRRFVRKSRQVENGV